MRSDVLLCHPHAFCLSLCPVVSPVTLADKCEVYGSSSAVTFPPLSAHIRYQDDYVKVDAVE